MLLYRDYCYYSYYVDAKWKSFDFCVFVWIFNLRICSNNPFDIQFYSFSHFFCWLWLLCRDFFRFFTCEFWWYAIRCVVWVFLCALDCVKIMSHFVCVYELTGAFAFPFAHTPENGMFYAQQRIMLCQICNRIAYIFRIYIHSSRQFAYTFLFHYSISSSVFSIVCHVNMRVFMRVVCCCLCCADLWWCVVFCIQCEMIWAPKTPANSHSRNNTGCFFGWGKRKMKRRKNQMHKGMMVAKLQELLHSTQFHSMYCNVWWVYFFMCIELMFLLQIVLIITCQRGFSFGAVFLLQWLHVASISNVILCVCCR